MKTVVIKTLVKTSKILKYGGSRTAAVEFTILLRTHQRPRVQSRAVICTGGRRTFERAWNKSKAVATYVQLFSSTTDKKLFALHSTAFLRFSNNCHDFTLQKHFAFPILQTFTGYDRLELFAIYFTRLNNLLPSRYRYNLVWWYFDHFTVF